MNNQNIRHGYTIVELIVTITILGILATIGFISFQGFSLDSRNVVRLSDVQGIKESLENMKLNQGRYPETTQPQQITYKGAPLWNQGAFGTGTIMSVPSLNTVPLDPLTGTPYTYAVSREYSDFELGYAMEGDDFIETKDLVNITQKTHAGFGDLITGIDGNYEGKILKVSTGAVDYIVAIPTMILTSREYSNIDDIIREKKMTYQGYEVLPLTYEAIDNNPTRIFDLSHADITVFEGDFESLRKDSYRLQFYEKLSNFYNNSQLRFTWEYEGFSSVYADMFNPTGNFSDIACKTTDTLLNIRCADYDVYGNLEGGGNTQEALVKTQSGSYAGQWNFGRVFYSSRHQNTQGLQGADHARNTYGMAGNLSRSVGTKWKQFTQGKKPDIFLGGYDINDDGNENMIYGYAGKLFLGDTVTGGVIWEGTPYDIRAILGIESILDNGNGPKSIIVAVGPSWIVGVIDGETGKLGWTSTEASGPMKTLKPDNLWAAQNYKVYDINPEDGKNIREYHFKQWYDKYHSFEFFEQGGEVVGETLWSSHGYGNYNEGTPDGYQVNQFAMGTVDGKNVVGTKGSTSFAFYSGNVDSNLSGINQFKMPAFGKISLNITRAGWQSGIGYFYDMNDDGNTEYISKINEELYNDKMSKVAVAGWDGSKMTQFFSLSQPEVFKNGINISGGLVAQGQHVKPIPLKNPSDPENSYILTYGKDPAEPNTKKWMMLKYSGTTPSGYKKTAYQNETYNTDIIYDKFNSAVVGDPVGIFDNGNKDYVVTRKKIGSQWYYYFYNFTGPDSFQTLSTIKIGGSFRGDRLFGDYSVDTRREKNKDAGVFFSGADTDNNGLNEFISITGGYYFRSYEITDAGVNEIKAFGPYAGAGGTENTRIKYGLTDDLQDMYIITYNTTSGNSNSNTINYYRTTGGNGAFTKQTSDQFSSGGEIRDLLISKLGTGADNYNKLMIQGLGMFDARNAQPTIPPLKLSDDYFYSWDMDGDYINEIFKNYTNASGATIQGGFTFNSPGNHTQKYPNAGWVGDLDGDGVEDRSWAYCKNDADNTKRIWFRSTSGATGNEIAPDIDWGVGTGWCSGGGIYAAVSEDFDGDGKDELAAGVAARNTRIISYSGSSVTEGNEVYEDADWYTLLSVDFDGDGKNEIIRGMDHANIFKGNPSDITQLTLLTNIDGNVKSTAGIGGGTPTVFRKNNTTYVGFRGVDGQVSVRSWDGFNVIEHFNNYYQNTQVYPDDAAVIADGLIPLPTADVLLGDFIGDHSVQVLVGGGDGYVYIIGLDGGILKAYNVGAPIKRIIFGDTNEDDILDILVSAEDGYVHQISSSRLNPPSIIRDGQTIGSDDRYQHDPKLSSLHFPSVSTAEGSFIQLYNKTQKSVVFDWIDIGVENSVCVISPEIGTNPDGCIEAGKQFQLIENTLYQWRVQSYDDEVSSPIAVSNGFTIQ